MKAWLIVACALVAHFGPSVAQDAAPAPLDLRRPPGERTYLFTSRQQSPAGTSAMRVLVRVITRRDSAERVVLVEASERAGSGAARPFELDAACRAAMGGDSATLGVMTLDQRSPDVSALVPACVPESLFGAATDIMAVLLIQLPGRFGVESLHQPGDSAPVPAFETTWSRPPHTLAARIRARSGWSHLTRVGDGLVVVVWDPGVFELTLLRQITPGTKGLMYGSESMAVEVTIEAATGALVSARSLRDTLSLTLWMPHEGGALPEAQDLPARAGMPVAMSRTIAMVPVRD